MTRSEWSFLATIAIVALMLRLVGIGWGAPTSGRYLSWSPDEGSFTSMLYQINPARLDLNPKRFDIPSFTPYALGAALVVGKLMGLVEVVPSKDYYVAHLEQWGRVFIAGRLVSVLFAGLSVIAIGALLRRLYHDYPRWLPPFGAVLLAVAPGHVAWSHYLSQNPLVTFWVLVAFYFLVALIERPVTYHYLLAGLFSGIAFSTNYNALPLFLLLPLAHVLAWRPTGRAESLPHAALTWRAVKQLLLAGAAAILGFIVVTPYSILDFPTFWHWIVWVNSNLSGGLEQVSLLESTRRLFLDVLPSTIGWGPYLLGWGGIVWALIERRRRAVEWLALAFLALFALMVARSGHRLSVGRLLPMAAVWLLPAIGLLGRLWLRAWKGAAVLAALALATALVPALAVDVYFVRDTVRRDASAWIRDNIPSGATVGTIYEPWYFTPDILGLDYFHPETSGLGYQYQVYQYSADRLREAPAEWLVVASQELGERFAASAEPTKAEFCAILEAQYRRVAEFRLCERIGWACPVLESHPALLAILWPAPDVWVFQRGAR